MTSITPDLKRARKATIAIIILLISTLLLLLNTCRMNRKLLVEEGKVDSLSLANQTLDTIISRNKKVIISQDVIITSNKHSLSALTDTIFDLKRKDQKNTSTIAYYKEVTKTKLPPTYIPYKDTIAFKQFKDSLSEESQAIVKYMQDSTITVPRTSILTSPNYSIAATVNRDYLSIDAISIPDTLQLRFVESKGNLFKKSSVTVQFFHSNPYITTTSANSAVYIPKRKSFAQRVLLPIAVGVGAGLLIK